MSAIKISVVAFQEGDTWVAQCVEYDITAHAAALPRLPEALNRALAQNLSINAELGRNALDGIPPAPDRFREMFRAGLDLKVPRPAKSAVEIGKVRVAEAIPA